VAMPEETRPAAWLRSFRLSGFALAMLALVVVGLVMLAAPLKTLVEQRQQIAQLQQAVDEAQQTVDELTKETARWEDPVYVEAQARDRLYYVRPGDVSYLVIGESSDPTPLGELPISGEIQATKVDWLTGLLSSAYVAGLTEATPEQLDSPQQGTGG